MLKGNQSSTMSNDEISGLPGGESMEIKRATTVQSKMWKCGQKS